MSVTVRDMIRAVQHEVLKGELTPGRAADLMGTLTALLGNVNDEIRDADMEYARVLLEHLAKDEAANRARIRAETTSQYRRKREARDTKELTVELIRSLKFLLKAKSEEMRYT
jgi:hypothetical protein